MVIKFEDIAPDEIVPRGGKGLADTYAYEVMKGLGIRFKTFNMMMFEAGSATGFHKHIDDIEVYLMLDGNAMYNDNGIEVAVETGDLMLCNKGEGHSIAVTGDDPITILAFIAETVE